MIIVALNSKVAQIEEQRASAKKQKECKIGVWFFYSSFTFSHSTDARARAQNEC